MAEIIYFNGISYDAMKEFLDSKTNQYNREAFIDTDPVSIPHRFRQKQDICKKPRMIRGFFHYSLISFIFSENKKICLFIIPYHTESVSAAFLR
jgi:hypothetical protein